MWMNICEWVQCVNIIVLLKFYVVLSFRSQCIYETRFSYGVVSSGGRIHGPRNQ